MTPQDEALHAGMTRKPLKDTRTDKQKVTYLLRKHEMTEELLKHAMGKIDALEGRLDALMLANKIRGLPSNSGRGVEYES